jgi:hypothetical protein
MDGYAENMESRGLRELRELFSELDQLLKNPEVGADLDARGVNLSLALVAKDALCSYLLGDPKSSAEDFLTVGEEIRARSERKKTALS